jgi:hypothetical protein
MNAAAPSPAGHITLAEVTGRIVSR